MSMEQFEEKLMDIFEVDALNDDDVLEDFDEYDSLAVLSIIATIGSDFGKTVSVADIKNAKTVKGLKELVK